MSLPESVVAEWEKNHALPEEYPVHTVKDGSAWEFIEIAEGKRLCLYPFTKNSIRYLYQYALTQGHRTPRYISCWCKERDFSRMEFADNRIF